jgi:hypothetical protein
MTWKRLARLGILAGVLCPLSGIWAPAQAVSVDTPPSGLVGGTSKETRAALVAQLNATGGVGISKLLDSSTVRGKRAVPPNPSVDVQSLAETAGPAGSLAGSTYGFTSTLRYNNAGLYAATYTLAARDIGDIKVTQVPMPTSIALLGFALGLGSVASFAHRRSLRRSG